MKTKPKLKLILSTIKGKKLEEVKDIELLVEKLPYEEVGRIVSELIYKHTKRTSKLNIKRKSKRR